MSVFSFLRDVVSADTESDQKKRLKKGQFRFYADQQRAQGNKTPGTNPVSQARNLAVGSAREIAKVNVNVPLSIAENAVNSVQKVRGKKPVELKAQATDPISKLVFGDAPIETYETRRKGYEKALKSGESILPDSDKTKQWAGPLSFIGMAGILASDATPGGGAKGGLGKQLIKASTKEEVKKLIPSVGDDVAQAIATTKDPNIIKNILSKQAPLESLKQEAKTYYHATEADSATKIQNEGFVGSFGKRSQASKGSMEKGVFLYPDDKEAADIFGKNLKNPVTIETKVNGKIYDAESMSKYGWEDDLQTQEIANRPDIVEQLRKDGYVGVTSTELGTPTTFVFEPSAIKSQPPKSLKQEARKYKSAEEEIAAIHKRANSSRNGKLTITEEKRIAELQSSADNRTSIDKKADDGKALAEFMSESHKNIPKGADVEIKYIPSGTQNPITVKGKVKSSYGGKLRNDVNTMTYKGETQEFNNYSAEGRTIVTDAQGNNHIINNMDMQSIDLYNQAHQSAPVEKTVPKPVQAKNIHPDDQGAMSDFIDLQRGVYKPDAKTAQALEEEVSHIAEHYNIPMPSTAKGLANEFDKQLTAERRSASKVLDVTPPTLREATFPTPKNPQSGESVLGNLALSGASKSDVSELFTGALKGTPASKGVSPEVGLKTLRKQQEELYTKARAERIAKLQQAGKNLDGTEGYIAERAALKGELPKVTYEGSIAQKQGVEAAEKAFTDARKTIKSVPDEEFINAGLSPEWAKFNTQVAVRKITHGEGGVPTNSEIKLIEMVFGKDAAKEVADSLPLNSKVKELLANVVGIPRVLLTSIGDLSFGLRQGLVLGALHPKVWLDTNLKSVKFLANEDYFKKEMAKMLTDPDFKRISEEMKTALPSLTQASEEAFVANKFAEKIPLVKRTARAYDGAATYMRFQVAKKNLQAFDDLGIKLTDKELKDLGTMINTASGRGGKSGGWLDEHSGILSTALFSPRLWASRLQTINPQYYASLSGPARQEALKAAGSFAVVAGTMLTALAALGAQIETDPRSSDFLKAKFGNTRYDVLGGFQQNLVLLARELTGEKKSSLSGHVSALSGEDKPYGGDNRLTVLGDMLNNKLNPILGTTGRLISGEDRAGQPIDFVDEMIKLLTPLNFQSLAEAGKDSGSIFGAAKGIPSFFGTGVQTYGTKDLPLSDKQEGQLKLLEQKGVPKKDIESYKAFFQQLKVGPDRDATSNEINKTLATGDTAKAKEIAKKYNEQVMENIRPWLEENRGKTIPKPVLEYLNSSLINLTNASIKTRIQGIAENPDKYKLKFRSQ